MKTYCILIVIFCQLGCRESSPPEAIAAEIPPTLQRIDGHWHCQDRELSELELTSILKGHSEIQIIASPQMNCRELRLLWESVPTKNMTIRLGTKQTGAPVLNIIQRTPSSLPDLQPIILVLKADGLLLNKKLITQEMFEIRVDELTQLTRSFGAELRFNLRIHDDLSYAALCKFLEDNRNIQAAIQLHSFKIKKPIMKHKVETPAPSPLDRNGVQDLLYRKDKKPQKEKVY